MLPRTTRITCASLLAVLLLTLLPGSSAYAGKREQEPGPIHAGNTFGWWRSFVWEEKYVAPLGADWVIEGPGLVQNQHGMLTLNTAEAGSVSATLARPGATTGRWEVRLRSRKYGNGGANYRVLAELVPDSSVEDHCGALNIALNNYKIGRKATTFYIRNLPNSSFDSSVTGLDLGKDRWHTYAVEVTPTRISWFVDAKVITSELRPEALSGVPLTVRFTMQAPDGPTGTMAMNRSRMQMDWLRYWSTKTPNTKSVVAPEATQKVYPAAC